MELAKQYLELVRTGETSNYSLMNSLLDGHNEWHEAIQALCAADGLRVTSFSEVIGAGSFVVPIAFLVRPDGSNYPWRMSDDRLIPGVRHNLALIESDWGERLVTARERAAEALSDVQQLS